MAQNPEPQELQVPGDVGQLLDSYAGQLSKEFLFPVSRQQAFERLVRVFVKEAINA